MQLQQSHRKRQVLKLPERPQLKVFHCQVDQNNFMDEKNTAVQAKETGRLIGFMMTGQAFFDSAQEPPCARGAGKERETQAGGQRDQNFIADHLRS